MKEHTQSDASSDRAQPIEPADTSRRREISTGDQSTAADQSAALPQTDPPRTTWHWFTAPEFGAAGSGGAEYEPARAKG